VLGIIESILSTPSSTAIFFSVITSTVLTLILFIATGYRDRKRHKRENELKKIEELFNRVHNYSDAAKKYFWSIKIEGNNTVRDRTMEQKARDLLFQCDIYKDLFFPKMPLDTTQQNAEMYGIAGECDKIWLSVLQDENEDSQVTLNATKRIAGEVTKLDGHLEPIRTWCIERARKIS
jgi:hypothetical protein